MIEFIQNKDIYDKVILGAIPKAKHFLWIGTADIKDMYVKQSNNMVPFLKILSELIEQGVSVRLIHAKEPGPMFRQDFDQYPNLFANLERVLCPRVHFKCIIVDGSFAYTGSANLTGAGMGAKSKNRRNFESGIITTDSNMIEQIMNQFDLIWMGKMCRDCDRKEYCSEYKNIDI